MVYSNGCSATEAMSEFGSDASEDSQLDERSLAFAYRRSSPSDAQPKRHKS